MQTLSQFTSSLLIISLTLFLIDTYNAIQVGFLWGFYFLVTAVLDYPTGVLGDVIGYKKVFILAYVTQSLGTLFFFILGGYNGTLYFMVMLAIGISQESGALDSWFHNSYRVKVIDLDRSIFSIFNAKTNVVRTAFSVIGLILGGFITNEFSIEALVMVILGFFIVVLVIALLLIKEERPQETIGVAKHFSNYFAQIKSSLNLFFTNKMIFFYFLGTSILWAANGSLWHPLISIRLYREYTGSYTGAGTFRAAIFVSIVVWQVIVARFINEFKQTNFWLILSSLVSNALFFTAIMIFYINFPPMSYNIYLIFAFYLIYQPPMFLESIEGVLRTNVELDMIPNEQRNSMYSLLPTLARGFGGIFVIIAGNILNESDLIGAFLWLIGVALIGSLIFTLGIFKSSDQ